MPRSGGGLYTLPAGSLVTDGVDNIIASQHNDPLNDLALDQNTARPIVAGGTGATTAADARTNLGLGTGSNVTFNSVTVSALTVNGNSSLNGKVQTAPTGKKALDLMPSLATGRVMTALMPTLSTSPPVRLGFSSIDETPSNGSIVATNIAPSADPLTKLRRCNWQSHVAATNAIAGLHFNVNDSATTGGAYLGSATLGGGFDLKMRVSPYLGVNIPSCRARFGLCSTRSETDLEPSSINHTIYFGWDSADTNCQIIYRATGSATKIDLGANFPVPTVPASKLYSIRFFSPNNQTSIVNYEITEEISGVTASGSFTHPTAQTSSFHPQAYVSAGGTSTYAGLIFFGMPILEINE